MTKRTSIDFAKLLGGRLFELRRELKLHQRHVAQKMGISERVYRRYESGEQVPGSDKLAALLEDLKDLNPMWLMSGIGRMFKSQEQPKQKDVILNIVGSSPSIEGIVFMLKELEDEDLQSIIFFVNEKKKFRDLHTEMKEVMRRLEVPAAERS